MNEVLGKAINQNKTIILTGSESDFQILNANGQTKIYGDYGQALEDFLLESEGLNLEIKPLSPYYVEYFKGSYSQWDEDNYDLDFYSEEFDFYSDALEYCKQANLHPDNIKLRTISISCGDCGNYYSDEF